MNHIVPLHAKAAQPMQTNASPTYLQRAASSLRAFRVMIGLPCLLLAAGLASATVLSEDFNDVAPRPSQPWDGTCVQAESFLLSGWTVRNKSAGLGAGGPSARCVTQGFPDIPFYYDPALSFASQDGQAFAYAGFPSRAAPTPAQVAILWLVSPQVEFGVGGSLSFWTRRVNDGNVGADRLQVRTALGEIPPETGPVGELNLFGQFTNLLLDMNPTGTTASYTCPAAGVTDPAGRIMSNIPWQDWCHVTLTAASGLPTSGRGYIAFRYYAPATSTAPFPHVAAIDTFRFDSGIAAPPAFGYGLAPGSTLTATGLGEAGANVPLSVSVQIDTPGSGPTGPNTTTTLQCAPVSAPFTGFDQIISAGPGDVLIDAALGGSCIQQTSVATQTLHCTETRGAQSPITIDYQLMCPSAFGDQAVQRYAAAVRADDPALYWRLDETSGAASNSATGPSSIGTTLGSGLVNSNGNVYRHDALLSFGTPAGTSYRFFPNVIGRVSSGVFEKLRTDDDGFSLEAWLRFDDLLDYINIMGDRPNSLSESTVFFYLLPSGNLRLHLYTEDGLHAVDTVNTLEPNRAYHLVADVLFIDEAAFYTHVLSPERIRLHHELGTMFGDGFGD
jgi:hypothetical protein